MKPRPRRRRQRRLTPREATRRLTLDIPASLHFAMKMRATATGVAMVDEVTPLLMAHYADDLKRYQR